MMNYTEKDKNKGLVAFRNYRIKRAKIRIFALHIGI